MALLVALEGALDGGDVLDTSNLLGWLTSLCRSGMTQDGSRLEAP
jgi:hypothetical protein